MYCIKPNGSDCVVVCRDNGWYLKVYGGQLFYSDSSDGFCLCSISLDGFKKTQYDARGCHHVHVYRGFAIFAHGESNGSICKINIRTKEMSKLNDEPSIITAVRDGLVYYKTDSNGATHWLRLDGRV